MDFRTKLLYIVESPEEENDENTSLDWYDIAMMLTILLSLVPLAFKHHSLAFEIIDKATVTVFILDYLLRWFVSDLRLKKGAVSFFIYPLTPMAVFDLLTILPSISLVSSSFKLFKLVRLLRTFRAFRVFKAVRYSKSIKTVISVFKKQKESLLVVCVLAFVYVLVSALIVFNVEPDSFGNYFDAVYWATVSLTTMGYGDIYPVTTAGRIVTMISSIMGIAIIALPAGIITSGFMDELQNQRKVENSKDADEQG